MDIETLFKRMESASELALNAISEGILCRIKVDRLGLAIDASCGQGQDRLSAHKYVNYTDLKHADADILDLSVKHVLRALEEERDRTKTARRTSERAQRLVLVSDRSAEI